MGHLYTHTYITMFNTANIRSGTQFQKLSLSKGAAVKLNAESHGHQNQTQDAEETCQKIYLFTRVKCPR